MIEDLIDAPIDTIADRQHRLARIVMTLAFLALGLWIASGFIRAIVWGGVIAIAIAPIYARAEARWPRGRRGWLPALVTLAIAVLVLAPLTFGVVEATREAHLLAGLLAQARHDGIAEPAWVAHLPFGQKPVADWWAATLATPDAAAGTLDKVNAAAMRNSRLLGADVLRRSVAFIFALLTLFFLLRDRDAVAAQAISAGNRLLGASGERIAEQVLRSVRGTINGLILVGIGEGIVMALLYLAAGVPHPLLLGAFTGVAAAIPMGAAVLIIIAGLLTLAAGATIAAIVVTVVGLVFVLIVDHTLRPALIGNTTRLPFLWVLVGILGGVETLGMLGLFVGPAVMAVLVMLWREFTDPNAAAPPV